MDLYDFFSCIPSFLRQNLPIIGVPPEIQTISLESVFYASSECGEDRHWYVRKLCHVRMRWLRRHLAGERILAVHAVQNKSPSLLRRPRIGHGAPIQSPDLAECSVAQLPCEVRQWAPAGFQ